MAPPENRNFARLILCLVAGYLSLFGLSPGAARAAGQTVTVSAAISLKEALADIVAAYAKSSGDTVAINVGASGTLAGQIRAGAPVDLFISAGDGPVDDLAKAGLIDPATRRVIAGNSLVLIVPAGVEKPDGFAALAEPRFAHVAVGQPDLVPAGHYAMQVLDRLHITSSVSSRLVYGANVRQVLDYVQRHEADAGMVYATDAASAGVAVQIVATANPALHDPIEYPAVVITGSSRAVAARQFLDYLTGPAAQSILRARGFTAPLSPPRPATAPASTRPTP